MFRATLVRMACVPCKRCRKSKHVLTLKDKECQKPSLGEKASAVPTIHGIDFNRTYRPVLIIPFSQTLTVVRKTLLGKAFWLSRIGQNWEKLGRIIDTLAGGSMAEIAD
jgi:hypothetical protein